MNGIIGIGDDPTRYLDVASSAYRRIPKVQRMTRARSFLTHLNLIDDEIELLLFLAPHFLAVEGARHVARVPLTTHVAVPPAGPPPFFNSGPSAAASFADLRFRREPSCNMHKSEP